MVMTASGTCLYDYTFIGKKRKMDYFEIKWAFHFSQQQVQLWKKNYS